MIEFFLILLLQILIILRLLGRLSLSQREPKRFQLLLECRPSWSTESVLGVAPTLSSWSQEIPRGQPHEIELCGTNELWSAKKKMPGVFWMVVFWNKKTWAQKHGERKREVAKFWAGNFFFFRKWGKHGKQFSKNLENGEANKIK